MSILNSNNLRAEEYDPVLDAGIPSPSPNSAPAVSCTDVIHGCDKALAAKDQQIDLEKESEDQLADENDNLTQQLEDQKAKNESILHSPLLYVSVVAIATVLGGPIGAIVGVGATGVMIAVFH